MKRTAALLLAALAAWPAFAQEPAEQAAERERIRAGRAEADARFAEAEKACYGRFAVNDCIQAARRERNALLARLRAQELAVNEAQRKRKAAERVKELEERQSPERQQEAAERRARALDQQQHRARELAEKKDARDRKAAEAAARGPREPKAAREPPAPRPAREVRTPKVHGPDADEAARNRAAFEKRQREAAERRARVEQRLAERGKSPKPLPPDPPAP